MTGVAAAGISGRGAPLEAGIRDTLSARFGHDFSPVRVHAGPSADAAARSLNAKAYTVGNDIAFSAGAYDPLSRSGRALIAHELAHVAQHGGRRHQPSYFAVGGRPPPPAGAALERQADQAAALHDRPLPRAWAWERATTPFLGRVPSAWTAPPEPYTVRYAETDRTVTREQWSPDDPAVARIDMGEFVVPAEKGPWGERYDAIARAGGLQAVTEVNRGNIRADLWQQRAPTSELRRLWLQRVQWPAAQANTWWHEAGGDAAAGSQFAPKAGGVTAQIDHIVELQLGGTNVPDNLAPHTGPDNEASGRAIWSNVRQAAQSAADAIARRPGGDRLRSLALQFTSARQGGEYRDVTPYAALPLEPAARQAAIDARKGQAQKALKVHHTAVADLEAGTRPSEADRAAAAAARGPTMPYPLTAGPSRHDLLVPETATPRDLIENSDIPENDAARELISGLVLEKLVRSRNRRGDTVTAWLNSPNHPVRGGTRLPLNIENEREQQIPMIVEDVSGAGRLTVRGGSKRVHFTYPYLSRGELRISATPDGLVGEGRITPSVPLLSRVPILVTLDRNGLRASATADPSQLSLPPFTVTEASLNVSLAPDLSVGGHVGFALGRMVTGGLDAGVDDRGLFARGQVVADVPGLDTARGDVEYRPATGLTGSVVASASGRGGLVTGGEVRVDFTRAAWSASGRLDLMLPGNNPAELSVVRRGSRIVYTGSTRLTVPGLRPVNVSLSYDGDHVTGSARTTFTVLGMDGEMALGYRDGRFTGEGNVALRRGRVSGNLVARLDERGRISGEGRAAITIRPGLVGTVGVVLSPDQRLRVSGELRFPPYRFLEPRGARYQLFERNLPDIPLFAVPLGPRSVGLVARISAGMATHYRFGPGEIRDMVIRAEFDPLEDASNLQLAAEARLVLPAEAGLELSLRAAAGLSAGVASVTGGVTVTGGVVLRGGLDASARLSYAAAVITFDTEATIRVQPVLTLRIEADIVAEAIGLGEYRWPYQLAAYSYSTGLEFGLVAPFHYQSDQPLRLPQAGDIRWIVPDIDVRAMTNRLAGQVASGLGL